MIREAICEGVDVEEALEKAKVAKDEAKRHLIDGIIK